MIKKIVDRLKYDNIAVKSLLILCGATYLFLASRPKHGDFWILNYKAKIFSIYGFDYINHITINYPSLFLLIQGIWLKIGSVIYGYNLNDWTWESGMLPNTDLLPFWSMLTYLVALFLMVIISYKMLKNKWLSLLYFGSFSFISVIVMGQIDVFCTLFLFLAMACFIRSIDSNNNAGWIIASFVCIGVSIEFLPFAGMILPIYVLFSINSLLEKKCTYLRTTLVVITGVAITGFLSVVLWIFQAGYFIHAVANGESGWLLNLIIAPENLPPYHIIALWLLGYTIIVYFACKELLSKKNTKWNSEQLFIFYNFAVMAWFFISTYTHPQWWIIIIPSMLFILDRFKEKIHYLFCLGLSTLYIFYPMIWVENIDVVLHDYIPIIRISGDTATILLTLLASALVVWMVELVRERRLEFKSRDNTTNPGWTKVIETWGIIVILVTPYVVATIGGWIF